MAMRGFRPRFSQLRRSQFLPLSFSLRDRASISGISSLFFVLLLLVFDSVGTFMNWKKIVSSSVTVPVRR